MTRQRLAIFRADASLAIGGGHVLRCLTLADALADRGWRCQFASPFDLPRFVTALAASRHSFIALSAADGAVGQKCDLAVLDSPGAGLAEDLAWSGLASQLLVFEDLPAGERRCDILINQNLGQTTSYEQGAGSARRILLGPGFALLRPTFAALRKEALRQRSARKAGGRILLSLGLMDNDDVTGWVLTLLDSLSCQLHIDVVLGACAPHLESIRGKARNSRHRTTLHIDCSEMDRLMSQADIAIGAGGVTSWERCCLGLPSLLLLLAENQRANAQELDRIGAAVDLGPAAGIQTGDRLLGELSRLLADANAHLEMSARAADVCDGLGVERVVTAIEESA